MEAGVKVGHFLSAHDPLEITCRMFLSSSNEISKAKLVRGLNLLMSPYSPFYKSFPLHQRIRNSAFRDSSVANALFLQLIT